MKTIHTYTRISAVLLIILFSFSTAVAQRKLVKAREFKDNFQYSNALNLYATHFKSTVPRKADDIRDIAHCYLMMNDLDAAQQWLSRINGLSVYSPVEMLDYANALKSTGDYDNAVAQFRRYADFFPERAQKVPDWIESCKQAKVWIANPLSFEIINVESINSENSDFGLIPYRNGYIFSSDRTLENKDYNTKEIFGWTGNPYLKIFSISTIYEDNISAEPTETEGINSTFHNGPGVFDPSSNRIYYTLTKMQKFDPLPTNSDPTDWEEIPSAEKYINRLEIYSAKLTKDNTWEDVQPFEYNNVEKYSVGHPCLSADGKILYFVSNMPGGFGNSDIYYTILQPNGKWSAPVNAGNIINTEGKEAFPVLDKNGTFYFSSDRHSGLGGLDIFESYGSKNQWSEPENLTYPINSPRDDFLPYFTVPGISGYLSSNRDGGKGEDDIYYFSKKIMIVVNTKTRNNNNVLIPLNEVTLKMEDLVKDDILEKVTDKNGIFSLEADCGSVYDIRGLKEGYFQQAKSVQTSCSRKNDTMYVELILDKIVENKSYVLENIYYDFDKWNIRPDAAIELDKLVTVLNENPTIDIELGSHTDSRGTNQYNESLSQKRAESAVAYIISKGIISKRITAKGYGESKLRNLCSDGKICTDDEHQLNRRTEFTVTKIHSK